MTNTELLEQKIKDSGRSKKWIAENLGITYAGLHKKINNITEFKAFEVKMICEMLGITDYEERERIFFTD